MMRGDAESDGDDVARVGLWRRNRVVTMSRMERRAGGYAPVTPLVTPVPMGDMGSVGA
ncbi:hypothetical protein SEA_JORDANFARM_31 [Microbacterium phage JordanFarm]